MKDLERQEEFAKRQDRRKRRIRNQVIAYISLFVIVVSVTVGGFIGAKKANNVLNERKKEEVTVDNPEIEPTETPVISEPEVVIPEITEEERMLQELVETYVQQMTIEEKVASLFMVTPESITNVTKAIQAGAGTEKALKEYPVGGIIYFSQNIQSESQFKEMLKKTSEMSKYPIFLGMDEEGGSVSRLGNSSVGVTNVGDMSDIGATEDEQKSYEAYSTIGQYLKDYGINLNFAPVSDVKTTNNNVFDKRSFGPDPLITSMMVESGVTALQENGVSACVKHFPGHGSADGDSHETIVTTNSSIEEMRANEFLPFQAGIDAKTDFIMVGHISAPLVTGDTTPASLSFKMITEILKNELKYEGIIITDSMSMKSITDNYTSKEATLAAISAGADMILMPENFKESYEAVLAAITDGTITEERINESVRKIFKVKYRDKMNLTE